MEKDQQCTARFTGNQMFNCVDLAQKEVFARYLADPLPWPECYAWLVQDQQALCGVQQFGAATVVLNCCLWLSRSCVCRLWAN
ncbi:hypothetical protein BDA96_08G112000 [Sorghum bicolor]|uniref:Uncharacterized protein n=1 Tax=Sorghum bicolor TaxID=4558 RepID=A0A921QI74_SORBI|nr:hypothetical protein BDA96_08G112000 [Sorghum bicolor]